MIEPKFFLICQLSIYYTTYLDNLSLMFISYWESSIHMIPDKPLLSDLHTLECHFLTFILRLRLRVWLGVLIVPWVWLLALFEPCCGIKSIDTCNKLYVLVTSTKSSDLIYGFNLIIFDNDAYNIWGYLLGRFPSWLKCIPNALRLCRRTCYTVWIAVTHNMTNEIFKN